MKTETQALDDHQVKLLVEVEPDELDTAKRKAARSIAKRVKIPGFRPGKAPYNVIERQVGEAAILEDAIEILAQDVYPKAVDVAGIKPYGPGMLESIPSMEPPTFEFVVPLQAEVDLGDYANVRIPYEPDEVTDEDVENSLNELRERHAVIEPVDRASLEGDMVRIVLSGTRINPEEENNTLINERTLPVIIESEKAEEDSNEWPYPSFSRDLLNVSAGEEKDLKHTFSDESPYESLRGVTADFKVKVEQVSSRTLPNLDDDFAISYSDSENLEDLRKSIHSELQESRINDYNQQYDDNVITTILDQAKLKYPPQMVERELEDLLHDFEHRLEQQGLDLSTYLKINQKSEEEFREELAESAENRLQRSLVLYELANAENIEVSEEDVQEETVNTLNALSRALPEEEFRKLTANDQIQNLVSSIMADMLVRKTIKQLRAIASDNKSILQEEILNEEEIEEEQNDISEVEKATKNEQDLADDVETQSTDETEIINEEVLEEE